MDVDDAVGRPDHDPMLQAFLEEVAEVGERHLQSSRLGLRLPAADSSRSSARGCTALLDEYARRAADPDARPMVALPRDASGALGVAPRR